jgi:hypothetical protein
MGYLEYKSKSEDLSIHHYDALVAFQGQKSREEKKLARTT